MRLLTRSDFDGLGCGVLLKELGLIDSWKFVHPKDVQDGKEEVTENDILANIPFVKGCGMWFDHHSSEKERIGNAVFKGESRTAESAARVIHDYYGGKKRFERMETMIEAIDKVDSGKLSIEEILNPQGWILLGFIMDPRTGLGRFRTFRTNHNDFMAKLLDTCRDKSLDDIMADPDVCERVQLYHEQDKLFRDMVKKVTRVDGNVIVSDLRGQETIHAGNRFLIYSLYPEQNISIWIVDGRAKQNCPIACGHSIVTRTSKTDVGALMLKYGGGGHRQVGTCQVPYGDADAVVGELVKQMKSDG